MFSSRLKIIIVLALVFSFASIAVAQEASASPQPTPQPDNYVTHTSFKNRVFELKHRAPDTLYSVINLLTSGHKGAQVSFNRNFRTLTVRDFPENIATIEEALKRLDTPEPARAEIEFRMHVLIASNAPGGTNQYPADLRDAVGQLQSTLNFKSYYLLTSIIQRAKDRPDYAPGIIQGEGIAQIELPGETARRDFNYHFQANSLTLNTSSAGVSTMQLGNFRFRLDGGDAGGRAVISSDVGVRDGEKVIVGTAGLRDKALILVMSARLIK
ncbi:MAG TPA: hypothetical protein VK363_05735 [Pyrinomonadaceae bacterium]|nr:hypothetical protein [Pyrinomonadaceae bacterium]